MSNVFFCRKALWSSVWKRPTRLRTVLRAPERSPGSCVTSPRNRLQSSVNSPRLDEDTWTRRRCLFSDLHLAVQWEPVGTSGNQWEPVGTITVCPWCGSVNHSLWLWNFWMWPAPKCSMGWHPAMTCGHVLTCFHCMLALDMKHSCRGAVWWGMAGVMLSAQKVEQIQQHDTHLRNKSLSGLNVVLCFTQQLQYLQSV